MNIKKFYEELEENESKFNKKAKIAVEESIDTVIQLYKDVTYFKLCVKRRGLSTIFKLAQVENNVSIEDIKDKVKCDEEELFAWIKYLEKETGIDRLKISHWLSRIVLEESFDRQKEKEAIIKLTYYLQKLSNSRYFYQQ